MTKNEGKLCFCVLAFRNTLSEMVQFMKASSIRGSQWGGGFYGYRLKFWPFYGYRLILISYG